MVSLNFNAGISYFAEIGNQLPCRSKALKLSSSCSQGTSKHLIVHTGNRSSIYLFLLVESILLVVLAAVVLFCCVFGGKRSFKIKALGLLVSDTNMYQYSNVQQFSIIFHVNGDHIPIRAWAKCYRGSSSRQSNNGRTWQTRSRKARHRENAVDNLQFRQRRNSFKSEICSIIQWKNKELYSSRRAKKESVTIFLTFSNTSSGESSSGRDYVLDSEVEEDYVVKGKGKGKTAIDDESSSNYVQLAIIYQRSPSEPASSSKGYIDSLFVQQETGEEKFHGVGKVVKSMASSSS
ncbi:hypothetical protein F3Y22_tig00113123pilonHSYRG00250 [Hibiscus syriacus]|uniref:Uncharacterized protein n=1 Tax=Hibiscus syriacus TaxID=106335 RepID=A0A6A2Y0U5_HIBSY|nr:hypothetical protein F3Y22_tig00113123pilonHSYRG00250 [Hibiscus syriacus]